MNHNRKVITSIHLSPAMNKALHLLSEQTRVPMAEHVREAVNKHLSNHGWLGEPRLTSETLDEMLVVEQSGK